MHEVSVQERLPRDVLWIAAAVVVYVTFGFVRDYGVGVDSHAYWLAGRHLEYGPSPLMRDAYLYSPVFAQAISPIAQLPWPVFCTIFTVAPAIAFAWLLHPLPWSLAVPLWSMTLLETLAGNIYWLLALVAVLGFRRPSGWAVGAVTKVTVCLGPIWHLARREWRPVAEFAALTTAVVLASVAVDAPAWREWVGFLVDLRSKASDPVGMPFAPPLLTRLPVAIGLVAYGAVNDKRWLLPVAMVLATPVLEMTTFTMLAAIPRLRSTHLRDRRAMPGSNG